MVFRLQISPATTRISRRSPKRNFRLFVFFGLGKVVTDNLSYGRFRTIRERASGP